MSAKSIILAVARVMLRIITFIKPGQNARITMYYNVIHGIFILPLSVEEDNYEVRCVLKLQIQSANSRSSTDRTQVSGTCDAGSIPAGSTISKKVCITNVYKCNTSILVEKDGAP